jgi:hypothetical protein
LKKYILKTNFWSYGKNIDGIDFQKRLQQQGFCKRRRKLQSRSSQLFKELRKYFLALDLIGMTKAKKKIIFSTT